MRPTRFVHGVAICALIGCGGGGTNGAPGAGGRGGKRGRGERLFYRSWNERQRRETPPAQPEAPVAVELAGRPGPPA